MELNFQELSGANTQKPYTNSEQILQDEITNYNSYWEQKPVEPLKKKRITFDDILGNMNLVVSTNGVLQSMSSKQFPVEEQQPFYSQQQPYYPIPSPQQQPIDPSVKHSYIYNKYFKDYRVATQQEPEIRRPQTIEELKQMLLEDRIRAEQQRRHIAQVKSTKMLYTNNAPIQGPIQMPIQSSKNSLGRMNFR